MPYVLTMTDDRMTEAEAIQRALANFPGISEEKRRNITIILNNRTPAAM